MPSEPAEASRKVNRRLLSDPIRGESTCWSCKDRAGFGSKPGLNQGRWADPKVQDEAIGVGTEAGGSSGDAQSDPRHS